MGAAWRFLVSIGSKAWKYGAALFTSKGAGRALNAALTAWTIWDIFSDDDTPEVATQNLISMILPKSVMTVILTNAPDTEALSFGFQRAGMDIMEIGTGGSYLRGLSYATVGDYITRVSDPSSFLFTPDETKEILGKVDSILEDFADKTPGSDDEESLGSAGFEDMLDEVDWDELDPARRKQLDYLAYFFSTLDQVTEKADTDGI